jgi:hypothetical protein
MNKLQGIKTELKEMEQIDLQQFGSELGPVVVMNNHFTKAGQLLW